MSTAVQAPQQYNQPSRKGKKAWRKHIDLTDVQEGLERVREEEIEGGVLAEKPSEELFVLDTVGSDEIRKKHNLKNVKPLRSDQILAQRSAVPAVDNRKRPSNSKVTDGIIQPKAKRPRSDWVTHEEWLRLKKVAKEGNVEIQGSEGTPVYDPWADDTTTSTTEDRFNFIPKPKPKVVPPTLKMAPISLAANGKPIPAVPNPDAGTSYNPTFEDWDRLLTKEGQKEVEAEKQRIAEAKAEEERLARIAAAAQEDDDMAAQSDDESAWEGFESEYEAAEIKKKRPERKTKAERNKIKRRKEAERKAKWEAQMKKREQQAVQAKTIAKELEEKEKARKQQLQKADDSSSEEGDPEVLRKRRFGKFHVPEKPLELVLPDELQDSLRLLKPEGNLLGDRFRTLMLQGKLEVRKPITQPKKAKRKLTEKWAYKDFKI
ncbi:hypothetical protein VTO42DRAFT_8826 [Malbranchea cinnamomea]